MQDGSRLQSIDGSSVYSGSIGIDVLEAPMLFGTSNQLQISSSCKAKDIAEKSPNKQNMSFLEATFDAIINTPTKVGKKILQTVTSMFRGKEVVDLDSSASPEASYVPKPSPAIKSLDIQVERDTHAGDFVFTNVSENIVDLVLNGNIYTMYGSGDDRYFSGISLEQGLFRLGSSRMLGTTEVSRFLLSCKLRAEYLERSLSTFVVDPCLLTSFITRIEDGRNYSDEELRKIVKDTIEAAARHQILEGVNIQMVSKFKIHFVFKVTSK